MLRIGVFRRDIGAVVKIFEENKVRKPASLDGLQLTDVNLRAKCPAGYVGALRAVLARKLLSLVAFREEQQKKGGRL